MATTPICNPHICRVLLGTWGTLGYYGVLWGAVGYCVGTMGYCVVMWGYCRVLNGTAGYCWLLMGTGEYWVVLGCTGEVNRGTGGIAGYCGILWVLESNREYCVALFGLATFFCRIFSTF